MLRRALLLLLLTVLPAAAPGTYETLKTQAERSYDEKSFSRAHDLYVEASKLPLSPEDKRWVAMRVADTLWRSQHDQREAARKQLGEIVDDDENRGRAWAEANESLGDLHWTLENNQSAAEEFYTNALDWWAGSDDLPLARKRYLAIVFRMAEPRQNAYYPRGFQRIQPGLPVDTLVNAVAIAPTAEEKAHARYLLGVTLLNEGKPESVERGIEVLDEVMQAGKTTSWYGDALFAEATRYNTGVPVIDDKGDVTSKPDPVKALELYRRIVTEFAPGDSPYLSEAQAAIHAIESPQLDVVVGATFLPASEQEVVLSWRNVKQVDLAITAVDLVNDMPVSTTNPASWANDIITYGRTRVRSWTFATNDRGDHVGGTERLRITPKLPPGAYIIEATAGKQWSHQLILVTDITIITHISGNRSDILVCDALTSRPVAHARVRVWQQLQNGPRDFLAQNAETDANGFASVHFDETVTGMAAVAASAPDNRQAWLYTWSWSGYRQQWSDWKMYAFTDRPAYRPNETVHWKVIARARHRDEWITPANETIDYEITSPRNEKIASGTAKLSDFGSFWSDLPLTSAMPLGAYTIQFRKKEPNRPYDQIGYAQLFRLEEYKLPEFRVTVTTPEKKQYRAGETVEATIEAQYYFGGPVADANVEVVVHERPLVRYWFPWREFPWYYQQASYGYGNERKKETLRTGADGHATLRIETTPDESDTVFTIEARVIDASRREVTGSGTVNVTQHRYAVLAQPQHYTLRPGDKASIDLKASDANDQPVQVAGVVKVVRQRWMNDRYNEETITTTNIATDDKGEATFTFTPARDGYYTIRWTSEDRDAKGRVRGARDLVKSEASVWVTDRATLDLGYHATGVEIILDREALRPGDTATAMIITPSSGRSVLLTTSGDGIFDSQVLRLDGTAQLIHIPLDDRHTPVFFLTASSVFDRQLSTTARSIVVPPVNHFINVDVQPDRAEYEPRQKGAVVVTTKDVDGKPIRAEVALSVSDESVTAIQQDLSGDPRRFFFGQMRGNAVTVAASVQLQRYINYIEENGALIDDRQKEMKKDRDENVVDAAAPGGVTKSAPAEVPVNRQSVAEAITVTAQAPVVPAPPPPPPGSTIEVHVRSDFRSTAFWQPDVITGADGTARVSMQLPEALTTWRATARAVSTSTQVGIGSATTRTSMPLIVRLQAPRFFVAGDRATVSAVINNNTDTAMSVTPSIDVEGVTLQGSGTVDAIPVPAHGESRADWIVVAGKQGDAKLRVTGRSADHGDAMEKTFTVYEHGVDKLIAASGKVRGAESSIKLDLPHERRATSLTVQIQPSLAATMFDALPYLIDYPYGCTEQTMSRFLPAAIVARTMTNNGLSPAAIGERMFGGIEREYATKTHPKGVKDLRRLDEMTGASMARLYDFQHGDGAWGWWKEDGDDPFMTAYVVWGFSVAKAAGLDVRDASIRRAVAWLDQNVVRSEHQWQEQTWMLHAIAAWRTAAHDGSITPPERRAYDDVYEHRDRLSAYSRALLALTAHDFGDTERAAVLVRNLENGLKTDHWGDDQHFWWRWYESPVESTAFGLDALVSIDPKNPLIEPVMTWLVKNRRGAQWNNTRDTAITILALNDYLRASGELKGETSYELRVNGRLIASQRLTDVLGAPIRFDVGDIRDSNDVQIRRTGGPLYYAVEGRFVSLEEPVKAAGNEMSVRREYFRLASKPTLLKGVAYDRIPLGDNGTIRSGERVEVVITIETKNDYPYLMFEDLKPAGLEAVALQSGSDVSATEVNGSRTAWVYQELRDRNVALFIDHLPQGKWEIRYTLRAEVPGTFHGLPVLGQAMYVPEVRANSDEVRVVVNDQ